MEFEETDEKILQFIFQLFLLQNLYRLAAQKGFPHNNKRSGFSPEKVLIIATIIVGIKTSPPE